ncbi:MAG: hypothetical protein SGBAC_001807 [Bacillariaceae sp.]
MTSDDTYTAMILSLIFQATLAFWGSIAVYLLYRYIKWWFSPLWKQGIPGPGRRGFLLGEFGRIRREPFMQPQFEWIKTIGNWDEPMLHYSIMFGRHSLIILDSEVIREILIAPYGKEPLKYHKIVGNVSNILGWGLVTAEGEQWMRHRQIIQPAFFTQSLKDALSTHIPCLTAKFVEHWKNAPQGREIDIASHIASLTLDIIGRVAFSHEFRALDSIQEWAEDPQGDKLGESKDPFVQAMGTVLKPNFVAILSILFGIPALGKYFNPRVRQGRRVMDQEVDKIIRNAKDELEKSSNNGDTERKCGKSLLTILLEATKGDSKRSLNNTELNDEVKTFIFAGHETTATWCKMAIYALIQHPEFQEKVYEDIVKHAPLSKQLGLEVVDKMKYFSAFMQEVLRMYPPVGAIARYSDETITLAGKAIPPNTRMILSTYVLGRHPKYWDDPNEFKPDRWLDKTEEFSARIRFAFIPFSAGGRNCIGQRFATMEAKLIMAELIRSFVFNLAPSMKDTKFVLSNLIVMRPKPDLKVVVKSRDKV